MPVSNELQLGKAGEHLVCADLIMQGCVAFLADQGLPYDVIAQLPTGLVKIQVKACSHPNSEKVYKYKVLRGRSGLRTYYGGDVDIFAFVALDTRQVAYVKSSKCKSCMEFRSSIYRDNYIQANRGKYLTDYTFSAI